jgi:[ribosomal protein S5]-alanine N-acetyltransferase
VAELSVAETGRELMGRRVLLRPLRADDFRSWHAVRTHSREWLIHWEPRPAGTSFPPEDRSTFTARCAMRERDRQLGTAHSFGIFVAGEFAGEINLSSISRGASQSAYLGYWIDERQAGHGYMPESCVLVFGFAFEELGLHRIQVSIIPRNTKSRRVVEKLDLRVEGIAKGYLEIDGVWEDHMCYAITADEWRARRKQYLAEWVD